MQNVFLIYGVGGDKQENWFPWLKRELESLGCNVIYPMFPTPKNQTLGSWQAVLDKYTDDLTPDSIVVGHSLGVAFLLNVLEKHRVKAAFFVAGVSGPLENKFDGIMKTFSHRKFNWGKIKKNCRHFCVFHSNNDPYIPLEKGKDLAMRLGVDLMLVKGAGHFNEQAGFTTFPLLLGEIRRNCDM